MYQGTTPAVLLTIEDYDLTNMTVYVTFKTKTGANVTKTGNELQILGSNILVSLNQSETLSLDQGPCWVQVRFIDSEGNAWATEKAMITIYDVLNKDIINYISSRG